MTKDKDKKSIGMKKKAVAPNSSVLISLYNNKLLSSKVDEALDSGQTYDYIIELCAEFDFEINKSALSRYKEKRRESIETGVDLEALLDKRRKTGNIVDIKTKEVSNREVPRNNYNETFDTVDTVWHDIELLDEVIQKGFDSLKYAGTIEVGTAMKAIEIKAKITGNQLQGISLVGLRELRLRNVAKESAMTEALLQFVPEDKHEEVYELMEKVEKEFYENLDLSEEDRKITKALKLAGAEDY